MTNKKSKKKNDAARKSMLPESFRPEIHYIREKPTQKQLDDYKRAADSGKLSQKQMARGQPLGAPRVTLATWRKSDDDVYFALTIQNSKEVFNSARARETALNRLRLYVSGQRINPDTGNTKLPAGVASLKNLKHVVMGMLKTHFVNRVGNPAPSRWANEKKIVWPTEADAVRTEKKRGE